MKDNHKQMPPPLHIVYNSMDDQELGEGTIRLPPGGRLCFNQPDVNQDQNYSSVVLDRRLGCLCPWPGVGGTDAAQHSLDHQRRQRPTSWLLRRHVRRHAEPRSLCKAQPALHQGQLDRAGLRPGPHDDHLRHLSTGHRRGAYAQHDPPAGRLQNVPRLPPATRLLLHKQFQGGLQPGKGRRGLE